MSYLKSLRTPGRHETTIKRQFGSRVRFEGTAPVFDKPLILMAFTNRCGSHLLADYLRQTFPTISPDCRRASACVGRRWG